MTEQTLSSAMQGKVIISVNNHPAMRDVFSGSVTQPGDTRKLPDSVQSDKTEVGLLSLRGILTLPGSECATSSR